MAISLGGAVHGTIEVNGSDRSIAAASGVSLLQVVRGEWGLTGAKPACGEGACGACTVLVDGEPVRACITAAAEVVGCRVTTVEGLASGTLDRLQAAFLAEGAAQCGYCSAGMLLAASALLSANPHPARADVRAALQRHLCRCGAHAAIERAVLLAAAGAAPERPAPALGRDADVDPPRVRRPWDLAGVDEHECFRLLGDGMMVVWQGAGSQPGSWGPSAAWIHLSAGGAVTAFTGKVEVGQDNRTALSLLVAEELDVPVDRVRLVMGDTDVCPFDMGTFGSMSLTGAGEALRRCAAAARLARADHGGPLEGVRVLVNAPQEPTVRPATAWSRAGIPTERLGADLLVTGRHVFPSDVVLPGMLHGRIVHPPSYGAALVSADLEDARRMPGVTVVRRGDLVAVAAADRGAAGRALSAIRATWRPRGAVAPDALEAHLRSHPVEVEGWGGAVRTAQGDVDGALAAAALRLDATYLTAPIAHASLEPRVAVARWDGGRLTLWTGAQQPYEVRYSVAAALEIDEQDVRVIVPAMGGGFGSKHTEGESLAAALLARAAGAPVRVALTREEEFRHTYLRPPSVIDVRSGVTADGAIAAWSFSNTNGGAAALGCPYDVPNQLLSFQPADAPLAQGPYRALAATANTFARESHVDELAAALGADPVAFRLAHLADDRLATVLRTAAEAGGRRAAGGPLGVGAGAGIALGIEKGGRVATLARVHVEAGAVVLDRVVTAFECGAIVNPMTLRLQVEGATAMGLGGALFEAAVVEGGTVANASYSSYRMPRFSDLPDVEVVLVNRPDLPPAGGGETPIIALAPAIANAIHAACGIRVRRLPLLDEAGRPRAA